MAARHHWMEMTICFREVHTDVADDIDIEGTVLALKRSHEDGRHIRW